MQLGRIVKPNEAVPDRVLLLLAGGWVVFLLLFWVLAPVPLLPKPGAVVAALAVQWRLGAAWELVTWLMAAPLDRGAIACDESAAQRARFFNHVGR